jgi:hypothetical protein
MLEYVELAAIKAALRKPNLTDDEAAELNLIREAVSRAVEDYLEVETGYYIPPGDEPTTERVYGTGASSIDLPSPVFGEVTVAAPSGSTVPNFDVVDNRLVTLTEEGFRTPYIVWAAGIPYDVTGLWGYEAIPPQLIEACLEIIVGTFKERPENGFQGMVTDMRSYEGIIRRGWPSSAKTILDNLKRKAVNEVAPSSLYIA